MTIGSLIALAAERIVEPVEGMHRAIAAPWFAALGDVGRPVRITHDVISRVVYASIRLGAKAVAVGLDSRGDSDSSLAEPAQAFIDGLWGDQLAQREPETATSMSVRDRRGVAVAPMRTDLAAAFPAATGHLVVLVHGLIETERCWRGTDAERGVIGALDQDPRLTAVPVRYSTGLAVADNGAQLASLLDAVHAGWPVPVQSIALVGHSMGGLVVRSACVVAARSGHRWIEDASDVITVGTPHRGAPLEKLVSAAAWGLAVAPQTRPLAAFLDTRSQGIKDLRAGAIGFPEEADGSAPPGHIRHHFVAGVVTSNPGHAFGAVVGDLMVRPASSTRAPAVEPANVAVLGGVNHFDLLHDPAVIDQVVAWLRTGE